MSADIEVIKVLLDQQFENFDRRADEIARRASKDVIKDVMPNLKAQLEKDLKNIIKSIVDEKANVVVLELTGESYDDINAKKTIRNAIQWSIMSSKKSAFLLKTIVVAAITSAIGSTIGLSIGYLFHK